jgi:mannosyltransferase OCH1-like enzyme
VIPRVIWQTWETAELPDRAAACRSSWSDMNPEWELKLATREDRRAEMDATEDAALISAYAALPWPVMEADLWRYVVLYRHGGFYADIDTTCRAPLDSWLDRTQNLILSREGKQATTPWCQWAFAAQAGQESLRRVIDLICERVGAGIKMSDHMVHHYTGPAVFTAALGPRPKGICEVPVGDFRARVGHANAGDAWHDVPGYRCWKREVGRALARKRHL